MHKEFENKNILITGHTGFKGCWLATWLNEMGANVCGISLAPENQSMFNQIGLSEKISQHIIGDIRDIDNLKKVFNDFKPEIVFHLAAQPLVRYSYDNPIETYETNVMGSLNVLESAKDCGSVKAFIAITTDKCYENSEDGVAFVETDPMGGHDMYSSSKGAMEIMISSWRRSFGETCGFQIATARAGNVVGGGDWAVDRIIPDMVKACLDNKSLEVRSPNSIRPWQHVLDPLHGYLMLAVEMLKGNDVASGWNFGPNETNEVTVEKLLQEFSNSWGENAKWHIGESPNLHEAKLLKLNCKKANNELKWNPKCDLQKTIDMTVKWYKQDEQNLYDFTCNQIDEFIKG